MGCVPVVVRERPRPVEMDGDNSLRAGALARMSESRSKRPIMSRHAAALLHVFGAVSTKPLLLPAGQQQRCSCLAVG